MVCGIYKITNKQNGKIYIGSSKNIDQRWYFHLNDLRQGRHANPKLQNSFDKHGESEFILEVLREVEESQLFEVEQEFIDQYEAWKTGYNISKTAKPVGKGTGNNAKKILDRQLDERPTCIKLYLGHKEALKSVEGWQGLVRNFVEKLIKDQQESIDISKNS